jgi:hypothetical protein
MLREPSCMTLAALCLLGSAAEGQETRPSRRQEFPTFGVSVEPPSGWPRIPEMRPNEAAAWGLAKPDDPTQPEVRFSILYFDAVESSLAVSAANLAKNSHGRIVESDVKIGGLDTKKVVPQTPGEVNCTAYVCKRGNKVGFVVECRWAGDAAHEAEFKKFAASVRLNAVEAPVKHLSIRMQPMPILGSKAIFNGIEPMRLLRETKAKRQTIYLVRDFAAGRDELNIMVTARDKSESKPLSAYLGRLADNLAEAYGHDQPKFTKVTAKAEVWISPLMEAHSASKAGEKKESGEKKGVADRPTHFRHIMVAAAPNEIVHFACLINAHEPGAAEAYSRVIEKMAETIRPNPAAGSAEETAGKAGKKDANKPLPK